MPRRVTGFYGSVLLAARDDLRLAGPLRRQAAAK